MLFLSMIDVGDTMLLHVAGRWYGWTTGQTCGGKSAGAGGKLHYGDTMLLLTQPQDGRTDVRQRQDWVWCGGVFWVVGGNTGHALGVTDKILTHAEIKHYTYVGIHNEYTLASTVIGTIRYYKT
jgi:hypothetical protein